jgi:hypothetical protein
MRATTRDWTADVLVGGAVGLIVGAIVAINVVIASGVASGYEAGLDEVFDHSVVAGILTIAVLAAGPITGVVIARRLRRRREAAGTRF